MSKPTIIIIGAAGRMGTALNLYLKERFEIIALTSKELDLSNLSNFEAVLQPLHFDYMLLPAAMTAVDYCESHQEEAYLINAEAPQRLAELCQSRGKQLIYFSTDFVFDGESASPYLETDITNPQSVYAASKLEGEHRVLAVSPDHLVIRLSWLFGSNKAAFPEWIISQALEKEALTLPAEKISSPSFSDDIAEYVGALIMSGDNSGVFHLSNSEVCTWQEWGQFCLDVAGEMGLPLKTKHVGATTMDTIKAFIAKRPEYSALSTSRFEEVTGIQPRPWQEACREYILKCEAFQEMNRNIAI
ncbi:MAG: dTDP-4-dehydrorhamnose reductase [Akkermansiaceae bacterium]